MMSRSPLSANMEPHVSKNDFSEWNPSNLGITFKVFNEENLILSMLDFFGSLHCLIGTSPALRIAAFSFGSSLICGTYEYRTWLDEAYPGETLIIPTTWKGFLPIIEKIFKSILSSTYCPSLKILPDKWLLEVELIIVHLCNCLAQNLQHLNCQQCPAQIHFTTLMQVYLYLFAYCKENSTYSFHPLDIIHSNQACGVRLSVISNKINGQSAGQVSL